MLRNGQSIDEGAVVKTDVCIIGSGPAGVTAAWRLAQAGVKVTVIDGSRELDYQQHNYFKQSWPDKVALYNGTYTDDPANLFPRNEPHFLILPYNPPPNFQHWDGSAWERERVFGGTSTHWGGQSRPLDPITFEKRTNFPGWPIDRADLDPFYAEAVKLMKLFGNYVGDGPDGNKVYGYNFSNDFWAETLKIDPKDVPELENFETEMYQFVGASPDQNPLTNYKNFATRGFGAFGDQPISSPQSPVDVIVNATLLDIVQDDDAGSVSSLRVASLYDAPPGQQKPPLKKYKEFKVQAKYYVLACGAVANARQLLLSKIGGPPDSTLVGRYFMCHPLSAVTAVYANQSDYLTEPQQWFMNARDPGARYEGWQGPNYETASARFIPSAEIARDKGIGRCWFWPNGGQYYFEMQPNPKSRITLSDEIEPVFNQPRTEIDWRLTPLDQQTYEKSTALFEAAFNKLKFKPEYSVNFSKWEDVESQLIVNGHHIGTTRMGESADDGVVDRNLKVFDLDNLYVAGSSVFPTTGITNPTFTIITLSIRLGRHLANKFSDPG